MTSEKRIGSAQGSDDLGEAGLEDVGDIDIIRACGIIGRHNALGLALWRWRFGGDHRELPYIASRLVALGHAEDLVVRVLRHLADEVCRECQGRGSSVVPGTPVLSGVPCEACKGGWKVPLVGEPEAALADEIARYERRAAAAIMTKLGRRLEF